MAVTEFTFVGTSDDMVGAMRSLGIGRPGTEIPPPCPWNVGDFITYPAVSALAFRVTWRLYGHASPEKSGCWMIGLEAARHPLDRALDAPAPR